MNPNKDVHMIGHAHLDPVWFWPWTEGMSEIKSTFKAALDRLKEFPEFIFTCSSAAFYEWLEEAFPDVFAEIQKYVREGRWLPVGGWYVEPDLNIPCGESFARHGLYSQRYYLEKFGRICTVGFNVDSFGHGAMVPQILKKSGMDSYVFSRPRENENCEIPEIFQWESADGSRVLATRLTLYGGPSYRGKARPEVLRERIGWKREFEDDLPRMFFYGVSNHGGGPTIATLLELQRICREDSHVLWSDPARYAETMKGIKLPVWKQDLQIHAPGCFTAVLEIKQQNRRTETALLSAETLGALAHMTLGVPQRPQRIRDAWKRLMFNQFHDVLCGCCTPSACEDAMAGFGYARQIAGEQSNRALQQITWQIDTLGDDELPNSKDNGWKLWGFADRGTPMVVYNPMPFAVEVPVKAGGVLGRITDAAGDELRTQKVHNAVTSGDPGWDHQWDTLFMAKLPPLGYATYWLHQGENESAPDDMLICREDLLENRFLRVELDKATGGILQITCKSTGNTYLTAPGSVGVVMDERESDTWGHGILSYRKECGRFGAPVFRCLEFGPVRAKVRVTTSFGGSLLRQDYILERDARHLDIAVCADWREQHKMLKLEFPVNVSGESYTAEIPYGTVVRPADGTEKPMQRWLDLSADGRGLAVVNDSNYAADVLGSTLRMTVLRSPKYADHNGERDENGERDPFGEFTEQGRRFVRFRLVPHEGDWRRAGVPRHAAVVNTPVHPVYETYHKGKLPQCLSGLELDAPGVSAVALKEAEEGGAYILRCCESFGEHADCRIALPMISRSWQASFTPWEIKTFRIPYDPALPVVETDLLERGTE